MHWLARSALVGILVRNLAHTKEDVASRAGHVVCKLWASHIARYLLPFLEY